MGAEAYCARTRLCFTFLPFQYSASTRPEELSLPDILLHGDHLRRDCGGHKFPKSLDPIEPQGNTLGSAGE